ncbi:MAG: hypothetical protein WBH47_07040, partial [Streptosporangiaceae bacterium]
MTEEPASVPRRRAAQDVALAAARSAWDGLIRVLTGPDPAPAWRGRSAQERWAACAAVGLLCILNAATVHGVAGAHGPLPAGLSRHPIGPLPASLAQHVVAVLVVAPLLLAARYPMLAWRIGWLALLLAP